ncbi:MAG: propionyl-CoA synthetase [Micavibrio sp. TMED2]|nr:propionyl-CoA synthetase [Alphaproteobacteria bacterium]MAS47810.1 propionyl-CoA synthetase [Alphaproteobacteria bacterium]MAX96972.1 propionyl-CoA synthetase [Alphaproteobacteria bacterium]OUT40234.1 MAG: propionyl-CoA synthetase [Micavibrio sp. TMED2]|tara:strand:- start:3312 stop:5219 length:1908 start_codon:yes stop_codon:yes gene_type:complete
MTSRYADIYRGSLTDPAAFWGEVAENSHWFKRWDRVLDDSNPPFYKWFAGGETNICFNAVDRHVDGIGVAARPDQTAIIHDSPVTDSITKISYRDLRDRVARCAGALKQHGVGYGDRVIIYMPMVPEAAITMLACARIGAVHSVVFGGFAPQELATRIDDAKPVIIVSASCGIEPGRIVEYKPMLDRAIELASHKPSACLILQRPMNRAIMQVGRDHDYAEAVDKAAPADCVPVKANDPQYILYTSGTTGQPKGVVRDAGGYQVALQWSMSNLYGVKPGEVYWSASDVGWVVGHSYIVYAPLLHGCTTILYEGKPVGTPDAGAFWRVIAAHKPVCLFTAPTALRAIRKEDPQGTLMQNYDISSLRSLFLAGERSDPDTIAWSLDKLGVPVVDHWWQTETGWPICGNPLGIEQLPIKNGSTAVPMPGWNVQCLDPSGQPVGPDEIGALAIKLPLPPGSLPTLWHADDRFRKSYLSDFDGYYQTGDAGFIDADGYVHVMTRTDDVINVAGHRLSTGALEEALSSHPDVAECAVIGIADELKGQLPLGFLVLNAGCARTKEEVLADCIERVRSEIGPVAAFKQAMVVERLPKTRSGKILRGTMQKIADAQPWTMPATIDDPVALDEIETALKAKGYAE